VRPSLRALHVRREHASSPSSASPTAVADSRHHRQSPVGHRCFWSTPPPGGTFSRDGSRPVSTLQLITVPLNGPHAYRERPHTHTPNATLKEGEISAIKPVVAVSAAFSGAGRPSWILAAAALLTPGVRLPSPERSGRHLGTPTSYSQGIPADHVAEAASVSVFSLSHRRSRSSRRRGPDSSSPGRVVAPTIRQPPRCVPYCATPRTFFVWPLTVLVTAESNFVATISNSSTPTMVAEQIS